MKLIMRYALLLGHLLLISSSPAWAGSDDFNDNVKDPAKWGEDMFVGGGTNAALTEIREHLEFTGSSDGTADSVVLRPWIGDAASYTQNWEVAVDLHAGLLEMPEWSGLEIFMGVVAGENIGNRAIVGMSVQGEENGFLEREFEWSSAVSDNELLAPPYAGQISTGDLGGQVRVAFDASTKTLYGSWNGIPLGWIDVDAAETGWGMTTGSTFTVFLGGSIWDSLTNTSSEVYADNFEFRSGNNLTYALTVQYGTGSGVYTNGANVSITASNAPSGWIFNGWVGSVQYISNASAATTTVTMPSHDIALTPSYKLIGTPTVDDFNDNRKDTGKWGNDVVYGGQCAIDEINQRLEFTVSSSPYSQQNFAARPWRESFGPYDQSWEVSVDAHLGSIPASIDYMNANLTLVAFNTDDPDQFDGMPADHFAITLQESQEDDGAERSYEVTSTINGIDVTFPGTAGRTTANSNGLIKISFDATKKMLRASHNGMILGWLSATNWNMSSGDVFGFVLIASVNNNSNAIASGEMFFDNFEVVGTVLAPDFTYTTGGGQVTITGYLGTGGAVTIPETLEGLPVTAIAPSAFDGHSEISSFAIPAGVTQIGDYAFSGCANLKALSFSGNAPSIDSSAFSGVTAATVYRQAGASGWSAHFGSLPVKTLYPVATSGVAMSAAFDGTNYLIGIESHQTATNMIGAQMLAPDGSKIGSWIDTGRSGIATAIAFDGTNYLMVWEDDGLGTLNGTTGWKIYGQRISRAGVKVGSPFALTSTAGVWFDGMNVMAYGGGKYLVTWTRLINPALGDDSPTNRYIAGCVVSPSGIAGPEFRISTFYGTASEVAFDGTNFLVAWREDQNDCEIRGRFVSPSGVPGTEISIDFDGDPSDNPVAMVFDGTNYVVAWSDEIADGNWDIFAQKVSKTGELVGDAVTVCDDPGPQMLTDLAFDGELYLAVWSDMQNEGDWDMIGRYVYSLSGVPGDGSFPLMNAGRNQLGGADFWNGKYLVVVNDGVIMATGENNSGIEHIDASYVMFITPPAGDDSDEDGLPDSWEEQYFGGLTKADNPAGICANEINTLIEAYVAGLNPTNSDSVFLTSVVCPPSSASIVQWNAVTGRLYNVYWSTNLLSGFQPLYTNYTSGTVTDTLHSTAGKCFYKLDVRLAP